MAPPKRKTGSGRVTPKGTKPGTVLPSAGSPKVRSTPIDADDRHAPTVAASSRYTPKVHSWEKESPRWWPIMILALFAVGSLLILFKYLGFLPNGQDASQWWIAGGLAFILAGLFAATRWR